jgi:TP901 family phage tail tape measure protein
VSTFDAGSVTGQITLNTAGWTGPVKQAQVDTANIRRSLVGVAAQCAATAGAFTGVARAAQAMNSAAATNVLAMASNWLVLRKSVSAAVADIERFKGAAATAFDEVKRLRESFSAEKTEFFDWTDLSMRSDQAAALKSASLAAEAAANKAAAAEEALAASTAKASTMFARLGPAAGIAGVAVLAYAAYVAILAKTIRAGLREAIAFEQSFVGVRKTVDGTTAQLDALALSMRRLATEIPASVHELNAIAEAAGQLGIKTDQIARFTEVMAGVGTATNMSADEAATAFAQWANITGLPQEKIENLASAVVRLGNQTASTERQIVEMGHRIAGAASVVGITDAEIVGLSATIASLGMEAEAAGSSVSTMFYDIANAVELQNDNLRVFAALTGRTAKEFAAFYKADPMKAVTEIIAGLEDLRKSGEGFGTVMQSLGWVDARVTRMISGLSGDSEKLRENIESAMAGMRSNADLMREVTRAYGTTQQQMQLFVNRFRELSQSYGEVFKPAFDGILASLNGLLGALTELNNIAPGAMRALALKALPGNLDVLVDAFGFVGAQYKAKVAEFQDAVTTANEMLGFQGSLRAGLESHWASMAESIDGGGDAMARTAAMSRILKDQVLELARAGDAGADALLKIGERAEETRDRLRPLLAHMADLSDETIRLIQQTGKGKSITGMYDFAKGIKLGPEVKQLQDAILEIETTLRLMPTEVSVQASADAFGKAWTDVMDGIGMNLDAASKRMTDLPDDVRKRFVDAARAAEEAFRTKDLAKNMAEAGDALVAGLLKAEDEALQFVAQFDRVSDLVLEVKRNLAEFPDWSPLDDRSRQGMAESAWKVMQGWKRDEMQAAIDQIYQMDGALASLIAQMGSRNAQMGSDFYRSLLPGPDVIGEVMENLDKLVDAAQRYPDTFELFGKSLLDGLSDVGDAAVARIKDHVDALVNLIGPDMVEKIKKGIDDAKLAVDQEAGRNLYMDLNPQVEIWLDMDRARQQLEAFKATQAPGVEISATIDWEALEADLAGSDRLGRKLQKAVEDAVAYVRENASDLTAGAFALNWQDLVNLNPTQLQAMIAQVQADMAGLTEGILEPPTGMEYDAYIADLDTVRQILERILGVRKEIAEAEKNEQQGQNWAKSSSDLEGWAGIADNITRIGQGLGQLGPKFQKAAQAARIAGDIIRLAMSPDPVSLLINGLKLAADAMGLFGDKTEEVKTGMARVMEEIGNSIDGWVDQLTDAIVEFVKTGKMNFKEFVDSVLEDMLRLTIKYAVIYPMLEAVGISPSAKGNVLVGGNIVPFAKGGVVERPSLFTQKSGQLSSMSENGPEAIMPLKRLAGGVLGVSAEGAGGGAVVNVEINNIDQRTGGDALDIETRTSMRDGTLVIDNLIKARVKAAIAGGDLDSTFRRNFGLVRKPG